jgi:hypothetical protein
MVPQIPPVPQQTTTALLKINMIFRAGDDRFKWIQAKSEQHARKMKWKMKENNEHHKAIQFCSTSYFPAA